MTGRTVYLLFFHNFNSEWDYCGVYGSRRQAEEEISRYSRYEQNSFRIEEEVVTFEED